MDIEQLKLVLQALSGLADSAKVGFIWWMIVEGVLPKIVIVVLAIGFFGTVVFIARLIFRFHSTEQSALAALKDIDAITGPSCLYSSWASSRECKAVVDKVRQLAKR
ncbi:hypothetical protein [Burkholderia ubonensis]|uniref:hypothetical protein n=1 Tax=Burkholderia ubonensis TaxID=101571 RepID=UPI0012FAB8B8|nr:hypothetical protein [Burkholderia ubonensis]